MAYTTKALMESRFTVERVRHIFTGNNSPTGGQTLAADVTAAITRAEAKINTKLGIRYTVPFASPHAVIIDLCEVLTLMDTIKDRHGGVLPQALDSEYEAALALLDDLASGKQAIPGVSISSSRYVRNSTNDGREHLFTTSHYDSDGEKIEDDDWAGSLDGPP